MANKVCLEKRFPAPFLFSGLVAAKKIVPTLHSTESLPGEIGPVLSRMWAARSFHRKNKLHQEHWSAAYLLHYATLFSVISPQTCDTS